MEQKEVLLFVFCAKGSNAQATGAECESEEAKTLLYLVWIINAWLKFHSMRTCWNPS